MTSSSSSVCGSSSRRPAIRAGLRRPPPTRGIRSGSWASGHRSTPAIYRPGDRWPATSAGRRRAGRGLSCLLELPEREYQHFGTRYLQRHVGRASPGFIPTLERLVRTKSWWDTVDGLATRVAGPLAAAHPALRGVMDAWVESEDIWLARVAIQHQERYRERTDTERLFAYCLRRASDREFFVRKAIGWALRSYAKVAPEVVADFLTGHGTALWGLSRREAERGVAMGRGVAGPAL